ncbi:MAG TPA: LCP family protein [Syntrophomonadaceae bacterium]|nr:LCP family protein [Syntrophomonadaceae bacterium]HPR93900.1 LCP family protein [Syntrophomonadaceae bacterium]
MKRMKGKGFNIAAAAVVFLVTFGLGLIAGGIIKTGGISDTLSLGLGKSYNILVMGIDAQNAEENSRSDTMILVSIDKKSKDIAMVWIPRDTRVETGNNRYNKINSVNYLEGPEAAMQAVGELLDLKVDYYVTTNFGGFAKIIDILGGVNIDVPSDMKHYDPDPDLAINLSKGSQVLNGQDALRFVRYRGGPTADIGRTGRQQQFIKALADEMFSTKAVLKLPQLLPEIIKNVHTNIPMKDMLYLAETAKDFDQGKIITQTLPGYSYTDPNSGASYWVADEDIANGIVKDLLAGKEFEVAQDPPQQTYTQVKTDTGSETDTEQTEPSAEGEIIGEANEETTDNQNGELTETEDQGATSELGYDAEDEPEIIITDPSELPTDLAEETVPVTAP